MAIEPIKRLFLIAPAERREPILAELQKLGVVQIEDISSNNEAQDEAEVFDWSLVKPHILPERRNIQKQYDSVVNAIRFLRNFIPDRLDYLSIFEKAPDIVSAEDEQKILREYAYEKVMEDLREQDGRLKNLHAKKLSAMTRRDNLLPWKDLDVPLNYFCKTSHVVIRALIVPTASVDACRKAAEEAISELWTFKVGETKKSKHIIVIFHKEHQQTAENILQSFDIHSAVLPCSEKTPAELIAEIDDFIAQIDAETKEIEEHLAARGGDLLKLKVVADNIQNVLHRKEAQELCGETRSTFLIKGWVPDVKTPAVEKAVRAIADETDLYFAEPLPHENPPIILKNTKPVYLYESVLGIYGLPDYREPDPTPTMGLFYFIGFGYCLADAGYGGLLALLTGFLLKKLKLCKGDRKFLKMLFLSAISAMLFGMATGSWFGNLLTDSTFPTGAGWTMKLVEKIQLIDPLNKHIMVFLGAALAVGFIQLSWGVMIKFYTLAGAGNYLDALFDPFAWLLFAFGIPIAILIHPRVGMWVSIAGLAIMLFFGGRAEKGIFQRLVMGIWTIYGIATGLLSDILSYSRLFALGLASGIVASVINIILFFMWPSLPVGKPWYYWLIAPLGWALTIAMLCIFHFINMLINVLGAFIHTARLQFVEFFPKFYQGGGARFIPFETQASFVEIEHEQNKKIV